MLKTLRKKGNIKAVMWVLAIIIIPAFVLWGAGSMVEERARGYAGKIFNRKITPEEYIESWEAVRDQALMIYGRMFDQVVQYLDLDSQAWDRLILLEEAKKQNIKVTDKELVERIRDFPLFQKEGRFDEEAYDWILKYHFRTTPIRFEEQMRQSLVISKLIEKIYGQVQLTEAELKDAFVKENEKAKFSYLIVEIQNFLQNVAIADEKELLDYYAKNKELFRKPDSVKVEYIAIDFQNVGGQVSVSDEEIEEYFQSHPDEFKDVSSVGKTEKSTPTEVAQESAGQDKSEAAPQLSDEIRGSIKNKLTAQKTKDKAGEIKNAVVSELSSQVNLAELAKKYGLSFKETAYFSLDTFIPEIGFNLGFYNAAFNLGVGEISGPIESSQGYIFLKIKDRKNSYIPEFSEVKNRAEELLKKEKAKALAKERAFALLNKMQESSFGQVAKEFGLTSVSTELITRQSYIAGIGKSKDFMDKGFSLRQGEIAREPIETERGYVLLKMDEEVPIDEEAFRREKEAFREKVLAKKQQEHFETWFRALKKRANLESNIDELRSRVSP